MPNQYTDVLYVFDNTSSCTVTLGPCDGSSANVGRGIEIVNETSGPMTVLVNAADFYWDSSTSKTITDLHETMRFTCVLPWPGTSTQHGGWEVTDETPTITQTPDVTSTDFGSATATSSTSFVDVTGSDVAVVAGKKYAIAYVVNYQTGGLVSAGIFAANGPTFSRLKVDLDVATSLAGATAPSRLVVGAYDSGNTALATSIAATDVPAHITVHVTPTASGTVKLRVARGLLSGTVTVAAVSFKDVQETS